MPVLTFGAPGDAVSSALFGANILAHRNTLDDETHYDDLVRDTHVTSLRYPGGSVTERYFDISDPDSAWVTDRDTGEMRDFIPISDVIQLAQEEGLGLTLVVPTRDQLSDATDANGDRYAAVDEDALRGFVHDTLGGAYGEVRIEAIEIGNEYWGSGQMSAVEYGRVASEMAEIVQDELTRIGATDTQIVVQMGTNFQYSGLDDAYEGLPADEIVADLNDRYGLELTSDIIRNNGEVNWLEVNNQLIMAEFDEQAEIDAVDAIAAHVYSKGPVDEDQRGLMLDVIDATWGEDPRFADLETHVTEWNQSGSSAHFEADTDFGLYQAHELLDIVEEFVESGVDQAQVWPLLQNTDNALAQGDSYEGLTPAGSFYAMLSEALPGQTLLDLSPDDPTDTEASFDDVDVHGFHGDDGLLLYVASTSDGTATTEIDLGGLVAYPGEITAQRLGVAEGEAPGSNDSTPVIETLDGAEIFQDGTLTATLAPGEILEIRFSGFTPTDSLAETLATGSATETAVPSADDSDEPEAPAEDAGAEAPGDDAGDDDTAGKDPAAEPADDWSDPWTGKAFETEQGGASAAPWIDPWGGLADATEAEAEPVVDTDDGSTIGGIPLLDDFAGSDGTEGEEGSVDDETEAQSMDITGNMILSILAQLALMFISF